MDHRSPPPTPPRELQLPSAVAPLRRRRTPRKPRQATIPAVPRPAALPVPSAPHQIPALLAVAGAADADNLMLLAHTVVSQADAEAEAASPRAPAPAGENLRSSPPLPPAAADEEKQKPSDAPPFSPLAVDHQNPPSMFTDHGHTATKASAEDCKKAACPQGNAIAGSSKGDQRGGGVASPAAAASPMQLGDDEEELEPGEIPPEKPAAGWNWNADPAHGSLLGKEEMVAGEEAKMIIAGEPAATGSSAHRAAPAVLVSTGVMVGRDGKGKTATEMSAAEQKRRREVFVGGLSRDAMEEDVRAALSAAGEITQVRMFMDRTTSKNKGYCFVAYRDAAMASKAVAEFGNVKICGKPCRVAVPKGNEKAKKTAQRDPIFEDYNCTYEQRQQLSPAVHSSYITNWDHHASYVVPPVVTMPAGYYIPMYHNGNGMYLPAPDLNHGLAGPSGRSQNGQSGSGRPAGQPHRSRK